MEIRIKFNNPSEEFCLGIYCHKGQRLWQDLDSGEIEDEVEEVTRLVVGFLIFSIDIVW